jgi:chorismate synthase
VHDSGPGRTLEGEVHGGTVGIVLDGRGRPLRLSSERMSNQQQMRRWVQAW